MIKPFRSQVEWFKKLVRYDVECIAFKTTGDIYNCTVLPEFEAGTMYKGMEVGKEYSLEELNL